MPFIPAPHCALLEILGSNAGRHCEMTIGVQFPTDPTLTNLQDLTAAADGWVNEWYLPIMGSDANYEGAEAKSIASDEALQSILSEPLAGLNASIALPANVAVCVTKRTGLTGRSARGRMYFWGIPSSYAEDTRHLSEAARSNYADAADALLTAIASSGGGAAVISYYHNNLPRVSASVRLITSMEVRDTRLDSQRNRLGKVS